MEVEDPKVKERLAQMHVARDLMKKYPWLLKACLKALHPKDLEAHLKWARLMLDGWYAFQKDKS